jgi:heterodisulfide reductase subunit C
MRVLAEEGAVEMDLGFLAEVREQCLQPIERCFHCQKCTSGCYLSEYFDYAPNQVIRLVQFGLREQVLKSASIWLCAACQTCAVRCPNGISIPEVMDVLRNMAVAAKGPVAGNARLFHGLFVGDIRRRGRVNEALLLAWYKMRTRQLLADLKEGMILLRKGKLPLVPSRVKDRKEVRRIFRRLEETKRRYIIR